MRRALALAVGAALWLLALPHANPSDLRWIDTSARGGGVRVAPPGFEWTLPAGAWLAALAALLLLALGLDPRVRARLRGATLARGERRGLAIGGALLVASLAPTQGGLEVVFDVALATVGSAWLALGGAPLARRAARAVARSGIPARLDAMRGALFAALAAGFAFAVANAGSLLLFGHQPHVVDEAAQLFHAKVWLLGHLVAPAPAPDWAESFRFTHMILADGAWYSQYPPGHVLLLAAGLLVGAPWLVNPICAAAAVLVVHRLGREVYGERTARIAALVAATSPFLLTLAASHMNHVPMLLFTALFTLGYARIFTRARPRDAALAGLALGVALWIRPYTAAAFAAPFAAHALVRLLARERGNPSRARLARLGAVGLAPLLAAGAGLLAYNAATTGDPLRFGYEVLHGADSLPGFGRGGWSGAAHTPAQGLAWSLRYLAALNQVLLPLSLPGLAFALVGLGWIRLRGWDALFLASFASVLVAYFFYWYPGWDMGPRFLFCAIAPLSLLTARSLVALPDFLRRAGGLPNAAPIGAGVLVLLVASAGLGVAAKLPMLAGFYGRNFGDGNRALHRVVTRAAPDDALVFVPDPYFGAFFAENDPLLQRGPIYARDLGPDANATLLAAFPDRRAYTIESRADYALVPDEPGRRRGGRVHRVAAGQPFEIEALGFQLSYRLAGDVRHRRTGRLGPGWKNADHVVAEAREPGAGVALSLALERAERRALTAVLTVGPTFGIVEIELAGRRVAGPIDAHAPRFGTRRVRVESLALEAGRNDLVFRVRGRNPRSRSFDLGLDRIVLDAPAP